MKKPISLVLVTATNCQVGCKTCPAGRNEKQPSKMMTLEMAESIIKKACREARVLSVCLYYFNEPFLHPKIVELVELVHKYKKNVLLSSNLSFEGAPLERLDKVVALEPFNLIVSLSGYNQETYERSHAGGDVATVKANLYRLAQIRKPKTSIRVSYHRYRYNRHEEILMQRFTESLGEGFTFTPYGTGLLPLEKVEARWHGTEAFSEAEEDILVPLDKARSLSVERKNWDCHLQNQTLVVSGDGVVYNCGTRNNQENLRGSFFARSVDEIMDSRKVDSMCVSCKAQGLHIYGQQAYTIPLNSVSRKAIEIYKRTGLQGLFPSLTTWGVRNFYQRPQVEKGELV